MKRVNLVLAVLVALALAASVALHRAESGRGGKFEPGRKLIPGFDPDAVATIVVTPGDGESVTLERDGERFRIAEAHGYPARNQAVNRLLRDLAEATLERRLGDGPELAAEVGIEPAGEKTVTVRLEDAGGGVMVELAVGAASDDGSGHFVERRGAEPGPIYLTADRLSPATGVDAYIDQQIVDVAPSSVVRLEGPDYVLERPEEGGDLELAQVPAGREPSVSAMNRARAVFARLELAAVHLADDPAVADLELAPSHRVLLDDDSGYELATAERDGTTFARIRAFHTVERLQIRQDSPEEELEEKAQVLERADEVQAYNREHGSWVYELAPTSAGKVRLVKEDLLGQ